MTDLPSNLIHRDIKEEMKTSFLDYAMSVIVARALPDIRDGLKPVHRRILYAMHELGLRYNRTHKKCARIVGDVTGKYHPHGEVAVYDSLVRMAQDFSMRYMLVNGQGNFGSVDGDPPAAMRYTEARLHRIADEMLTDLEKQTVDFRANYDESLKEPEVLPARIPNLLINGSSGIAVGMATNVPPHNITEVLNAAMAVLENPQMEMIEILEHIKGPDFPTAGFIVGKQGIYEAYKTGKGIIRMRARAHYEKIDKKDNRERIIITELPYQVNKANLVERIADLVRDKKIEGISDLRDESDRTGMRIVIELKRQENPEVVLNVLYKHSQLETSFGINMLALVDNRPLVLNLKEILEQFLNHRRVVIVRRSRFELDRALERKHILEGLLTALAHLDAIISTIRAAADVETAELNLMDGFQLSKVQAQAILEMRLQRLTGLERKKVEDEYTQITIEIDRLQHLLASDKLLDTEIKKEMQQLQKQYGDERRTEIIEESSEIGIEDMIKEEDMVVIITHQGYIKRSPLSLYKAQKRSGQGVRGIKAKEEDFVEHLFINSTHDYVLFFTNKGRVYWLKVYQIPLTGKTAKGRAVVNLLNFEREEKIASILSLRSLDEAGKYLLMATRRGLIKKTELIAYSNPRSTGIIALNIQEHDELISVKVSDGNQDVVIGTAKGKSIRFSETDARSIGRAARGVIGIRLGKDDYVIGMEVVKGGESDPNGETLLTVSARGFGKRSHLKDYRRQHRGGMGLINMRVTKKTGQVVGLTAVNEGDELMVITSEGKLIRFLINTTSVRVISRRTQGVSLQGISASDHAVAIAKVAEKEEE